MALTTLAHHIDIEWMLAAHARTRKDGAVGVDGQTADEYEVNLEANLQNLLGTAPVRHVRGAPVRQGCIPKARLAQRGLALWGYPRMKIRSFNVRC